MKEPFTQLLTLLMKAKKCFAPQPALYFFESLLDIKGREEEFFNKEISIKGKIFYVNEAKDFYSTLKTAYEMRKRGFGFLRPDLYKSEAKVFKIEGKYLRIPLTKVRNIGSKNAQRILKERGEPIIEHIKLF